MKITDRMRLDYLQKNKYQVRYAFGIGWWCHEYDSKDPSRSVRNAIDADMKKRKARER